MVWDKPTNMKPMTAFDWLVIDGHEYIKNGKPTLPRRRLDITIPADADRLHTIAHRLAGIVEELHMCAREAKTVGSHRYGLSQAASLLYQARQSFKAMGAEWEAELREAEAQEEKTAESDEHLRVIK